MAKSLCEEYFDEMHRQSAESQAKPQLPFKRSNSIPLLPGIGGRSSYLTALHEAALDLYDSMACDSRLIELAGQKVDLVGKVQGVVPKLPRKPKPAMLDALKLILHSLAHAASKPLTFKDGKEQRNDCVALPLSSTSYGPNAAFAVSYRSMKGMVTALGVYQPAGSEKPWLQAARGYNIGESRWSRIAATNDFKTWMLHNGLIFPMHPKGRQKKHSKANKSVLWLSNKTKDTGKQADDTAKPLDRDLNGDEAVLPLVNRRLMRAKIVLTLPSYQAYDATWDYGKGRSNLPSGPSKLYRQFAGEDGSGGRLFGHWVQQAKSALRRDYLTINGERTVELDYGSMQLVLLYAMAAIPVPSGDLYDPDGRGSDHRERMKIVLTISTGCSSRKMAINALDRKLRNELGIRSDRAAEKLYDSFWARHHAVCPHGDATEAPWPRLQAAESLIALRVLRYLEEQGIIVVPIHDSFVVQERYKDDLRDAMERAFADFFPGVDVTIK